MMRESTYLRKATLSVRVSEINNLRPSLVYCGHHREIQCLYCNLYIINPLQPPYYGCGLHALLGTDRPEFLFRISRTLRFALRAKHRIHLLKSRTATSADLFLYRQRI